MPTNMVHAIAAGAERHSCTPESGIDDGVIGGWNPIAAFEGKDRKVASVPDAK